MLRFFDVVFFKVSEFYYRNHEKSFRITGLIVITVLQVLNFMIILEAASIVAQKKLFANKVLIVLLYVTLLIANGFRYNKRDYDTLNEEWKRKNESSRNMLRVVIVIYLVLSVVITFGLAAYLGSQNWEIYP